MKSALFAKPNLKLFVLGALVLVCLQHFFSSGQSDAGLLGAAVAVNARQACSGDLDKLLREAGLRPSCQAYLRLSLYYEKQREYRKAMQCLRHAEKLAPLEDSPE